MSCRQFNWPGLRAVGVAVALAAVLGATAVASAGPGRSATAAASPPPPGSAVLTLPVDSEDICGSCLTSNSPVFLFSQAAQATNAIPLTVTATPPAGATIKSVALQYAPAGTGDFANLPLTHRFTGSSGTYTGGLVPANDIVNYYNPDPTAPFPYLDGNYDFRALVTDTDGSTFSSQTIRNVAIASDDNNDYDTYVGIQSLPSVVSGSVTLLAAPEEYTEAYGFASEPDSVQFEISQAGQNQWTPIGSPASAELNGKGNVELDANRQQEYETTLDTTGYTAGQYDIQAVAEDANGDSFLGNVVTVTIDNSPPSVTLANPGSPLSGSVALSANATADSGISSVRFEEAPAGSGNWTTIGVSTEDPAGAYTVNWETLGAPKRQLRPSGCRHRRRGSDRHLDRAQRRDQQRHQRLKRGQPDGHEHSRAGHRRLGRLAEHAR